MSRFRQNLIFANGIGLLTFLLIGSTTGCRHFPIFRGQDAGSSLIPVDTPADGAAYVSDVAQVWGLGYAKLEGIVLVTQLPGTGSDPLTSEQRNQLLEEMKTQQVKDPEEILASPETSMAIARAYLPPGVKKGQAIDVEIRTIGRSKTTSLAGGYLIKARMKPAAVLDGSLKMGHTLAYAEGPILVNSHFDSGDEVAAVRGVVLGGGVAREDRELGLVLEPKHHSVQLTSVIAKAINRRFSVFDLSGKTGAATAKNDRNIVLQVPASYQHNMGRFLQVVMSLAYDQKPEAGLARAQVLEEQLNDPAAARVTALRLEAIGEDSIPILQRGLSHQSEEVRFHAAQSLAYLGDSSGVGELERLAARFPAFRWHALTALTSLKEVEASSALANLLHAESAETRCGAFRALLARSETDPLVAGQEIADGDFKLHVIPSAAEPMLHIARRTHREIVIFNDAQTVGDGFLFVQPGLTARALGDGTVQVKRYFSNGTEETETCSNQISSVIRALGNVGLKYGQVIDMLKDAKGNGQLNTELVVDVRPKATRLYEQGDGQSSGSGLPESSSPSGIAGPMPELFQDGLAPDEPAAELTDGVSSGDISDENKENQRKSRPFSGLLGKMKRED